MDFIVMCPHCGAYIGVDRHSFFDVDFYHSGGQFSANGTLECEKCDRRFVMDIYLEPVHYNIGEEVNY